MHPAYSVIVFTTASGAGYGLLAWLGGLIMQGRLDPGERLGLIGLVLALAFITLGLLSSLLHLGRPERAWRALSQWRTSWLSREGLAALLTYVPAILLLLDAVAAGAMPGWLARVLGALALVGAIATIWCTGMIYASLPTVRAWSEPTVAPLYIVLGLGSGALLLLLLLAVLGRPLGQLPWLAMAVLLIGWVMKASYWSAIDAAPRTWSAGAATGLGHLGEVRQLEPPHAGANFVMREMGYQVARRHTAALRRLAVVLAFILPVAVLLLTRLLGAPLLPILLLLATLSSLMGLLVERWLFFAEAEHVSMLYYGRAKA